MISFSFGFGFSVFRTLESTPDNGGGAEEREKECVSAWIIIIFDGGEDGLGIEGRRVAHGIGRCKSSLSVPKSEE